MSLSTFLHAAKILVSQYILTNTSNGEKVRWTMHSLGIVFVNIVFSNLPYTTSVIKLPLDHL